MKKLILMRHAKSREAVRGQNDQSRPLHPEGIATALAQQATLHELRLQPDLVLCSDAERTRETYALCTEEWLRYQHQALFDAQCYMATATKLFHIIQGKSDDYSELLVIGHNPGIHQLALALVGEGNQESLTALSQEFPPAGVVVLSFNSRRWDRVGLSSGILDHCLLPYDSGKSPYLQQQQGGAYYSSLSGTL